MPELPEVETIRTQLAKNVVGMTITDISFPDRKSKVLRGDLENVIGQTISDIRRFGKLLIIDLAGDYSLAIHLKMTGRLYLVKLGEELPPHTHLILTLGTKVLSFSDARRFGYVHVLPKADVLELLFIKRLGKEPLKDLKIKDFQALVQKSSRPIKNLLLDQQKIAGIGNIYACEALWMAKINPITPANTLSNAQVKALFQAVESVLTEGIKRGGASDNTYRNLMGGKGNYQDFFKVYARRGEPCSRCGTPIERMSLAGRGTFFCPECQK
jgi:formamidopyrimidine-DNA glycosylase